MKFSKSDSLILVVTLLAVGAFCPNLTAADWGSLHGNNRSAPAAPAFHPQPQPSRAPQENHAPAIHPESHPVVQPAHEQPQQEVRPVERPEPHPVVEPAHEQPRQDVHVINIQHPDQRPVEVKRTPAVETDRRRMDIGEERRQSYFWSDYHAGMRVNRLPDGYRRFHIHDHDYFYFGGVYYDSGPSGYVVCAPPMDAEIPELPPGAETIQVGDAVYYYAAGAFYLQQPDGGFIVVAAPLGVTVSMLPPDATSVVVNGVGYFQADGTYYQPVMQYGVTAYLTVPQP